MTINLAAIESRNEERRRLRDAATQGPWDSIGGCKDDAPPHCCRYVGPAAAGPVLWAYGTNRSANINLAAYARTDTAPEDIAVLVAEVRRLAEAVADISHLASGHHREQPSHVLLHCLTIDIPAICDAALTTTTSE